MINSTERSDILVFNCYLCHVRFLLTCYIRSTKIGEISDISKCFENFVSQALGVLTRIYAAELRKERKREMTTRTFAVSGMKCAHCARAVENVVKAVVGVESAHVDLAAGSVAVTYDETTVSPSALKSAVDALGGYAMTI